MADQKLVEATTSFDVALPGGGSFGVAAGDVFDATDPIIKGREALFGPIRVRSSRPPSSPAAIETADAPPSGRRLLSGRRAAAQQAAASEAGKGKPDA